MQGISTSKDDNPGRPAEAPVQGRAWLTALLQRRPDLLARLAYFRERLLRLPRAQRRWLLRRAAVPLSAAALMLALSGAPSGLFAEATAAITVVDGKVTVANDGMCSLIEAINNANATSGTPHGDCAAGSASGADTIVLPSNGTFTLTSYDNYNDYGYNGLPEITSAIVIDGNGSTIKRTGNEEFRLISVAQSGDLTLNNVTLSGGIAEYYYGGAVQVMGGSLTVNDSTITGNAADGGAAIYITAGDLTVTNSKLNGNEAYVGGAIFASYSKITISDSELNNNLGPDGFGGGALYSLGGEYDGQETGQVTITNTTITGNSNDGGGALMVSYGTLDLIDSTVSNNTSKYGYGAGVYLQGVTATVSGTTISGNKSTKYTGGGFATFGGNVTISQSVIKDNTSGYLAGGVYGLEANLTISETTISNNSAVNEGGGVLVYNGTTLIENSTISGNKAKLGGGVRNNGATILANTTISNNTADRGGGVANTGLLQIVNTTVTSNSAQSGNGGGVLNLEVVVFEETNSGSLTLSQALITANTAGGQGPQVHSSGTDVRVTANNYNLFGASGAAGVVGFTPGSTDIVPSVAASAVLQSALADNGGPTLTHALVPNSPAIDAGPTAACAAPPVNSRDQRGEYRSRNADGKLTDNECDLGSFEAPGEDVLVEFNLYLPVALAQ